MVPTAASVQQGWDGDEGAAAAHERVSLLRGPGANGAKPPACEPSGLVTASAPARACTRRWVPP